MLKRKILFINFIFIITICILTYIFIAYPVLKLCKDVKVSKDDPCHHQAICWNNDNCNLDVNSCPVPCNSLSRWIIITIVIFMFSILASYITLFILYYIFNPFYKMIKNKLQPNDYYEIV